jgi:hypothetical protein
MVVPPSAEGAREIGRDDDSTGGGWGRRLQKRARTMVKLEPKKCYVSWCMMTSNDRFSPWREEKFAL